MRLYILEDGKPREEPDALTWGRWMEGDSNLSLRRIDSTTEAVMGEKLITAWISTVFLGIDHNFMRQGGPPILWETMVFGSEIPDDLDHYSHRYASLASAKKGHWKIVDMVKEAMGVSSV